jgi:hypothetical protein
VHPGWPQALEAKVTEASTTGTLPAPRAEPTSTSVRTLSPRALSCASCRQPRSSSCRELASAVAPPPCAQLQLPAASAPAESSPELEARLARLEQRLSGVYNLNGGAQRQAPHVRCRPSSRKLSSRDASRPAHSPQPVFAISAVLATAGKLVALEQVAAAMGMQIPDLEYPAGGGPPRTPPQPVPALPLQPLRQQPEQPHAAAAESAAAEPAEPLWPSVNKLSPRHGSPVPSTSGQHAADAAAAAQAASPYATHRMLSSGMNGGSRLGSAVAGGGAAAAAVLGAGSPVPAIGAGGPAGAKVAALGQELSGLKAENEALKEGLERLGQQVCWGASSHRSLC